MLSREELIKESLEIISCAMKRPDPLDLKVAIMCIFDLFQSNTPTESEKIEKALEEIDFTLYCFNHKNNAPNIPTTCAIEGVTRIQSILKGGE